jgi:hypothetical protein
MYRNSPFFATKTEKMIVHLRLPLSVYRRRIGHTLECDDASVFMPTLNFGRSIQIPLSLTSVPLNRTWSKQGFFQFRGTAVRSGLRSWLQLALFEDFILRRRNGEKVRIMPGFSRIMPGIRGRIVRQGQSPDNATVEEWRIIPAGKVPADLGWPCRCQPGLSDTPSPEYHPPL